MLANPNAAWVGSTARSVNDPKFEDIEEVLCELATSRESWTLCPLIKIHWTLNWSQIQIKSVTGGSDTSCTCIILSKAPPLKLLIPERKTVAAIGPWQLSELWVLFLLAPSVHFRLCWEIESLSHCHRVLSFQESWQWPLQKDRYCKTQRNPVK